VTPDTINFMARYGRGQICLSLTGERLDELELPLAVNANTTPFGTAFCVPIDAKHNVTTGISAADRAATVLAAVDPATRPADLVTPDSINFMARYGRGLICLSLTEDKVAALGLPMMPMDNRSPRSTAFTVSIDAHRGTTTGISARERAETIRVAEDAVRAHRGRDRGDPRRPHGDRRRRCRS